MPFITGAAIGFGREFARALSKEEAAVIVAEIDASGAQETAAALNSSITPFHSVECDVANENSVRQAVDRVTDDLGGVDILINNAARHLKKCAQPFSTD